MAGKLPTDKAELEVLRLQSEIKRNSGWRFFLSIFPWATMVGAAALYSAWNTGLLDAKRERLANQTTLLDIRKNELDNQIAEKDSQLSQLQNELRQGMEYQDALTVLSSKNALIQIDYGEDGLEHAVSLSPESYEKRMFTGVAGVQRIVLDRKYSEAFSKLPNVIALDCSRVDLDSPFLISILGYCPKMTELYLSDLSHLLDSIDDFKKRGVFPGSQRYAQRDLFAQVGRLQELLTLHLDGLNFETEALRSFNACKSLKYLSLVFCQGITDNSIEVLATLKQLEELDLAGTSMTLAGVQKLSKRLPDTAIRGPKSEDFFHPRHTSLP